MDKPQTMPCKICGSTEPPKMCARHGCEHFPKTQTTEAEQIADAILKASGSALRHYTMTKSRADILGAAQTAIDKYKIAFPNDKKTPQPLRNIMGDFLEFWIWEPTVDVTLKFNNEGEITEKIPDFTHYDFRKKWVIGMTNQGCTGSLFLPDLGFFLDLDQIGDCPAVGIKRPETP